MCTLVILRRPEHDWPVIIGANRDEMIDRPAKPPGRHWADRAEVVAGLDLLAGGSWLGINDWGVAAAVLNRHGSLGPAAGLRSRGELVLEALDHADAAAAAAALAQLNTAAYRSFNLILADNRDGFWLRHADTGRVEIRPLKDGLSIIAAGEIDDLRTRRLELARPAFRAWPAPDPDKARPPSAGRCSALPNGSRRKRRGARSVQPEVVITAIIPALEDRTGPGSLFRPGPLAT